MASLIYNSFVEDLGKGDIDLDTDTIKIMLVTSSYTANKDTHLKRSDVTNEITGTGYTSGGIAVSKTLTKDTSNDKVTWQLGQAQWGTATLTARGAVYYKSRGGTASSDELVAYNDFGGDVTSTAGTFTVNPSTITFQN